MESALLNLQNLVSEYSVIDEKFLRFFMTCLQTLIIHKCQIHQVIQLLLLPPNYSKEEFDKINNIYKNLEDFSIKL